MHCVLNNSKPDGLKFDEKIHTDVLKKGDINFDAMMKSYEQEGRTLTIQDMKSKV